MALARGEHVGGHHGRSATARAHHWPCRPRWCRRSCRSRRPLLAALPAVPVLPAVPLPPVPLVPPNALVVPLPALPVVPGLLALPPLDVVAPVAASSPSRVFASFAPRSCEREAEGQIRTEPAELPGFGHGEGDARPAKKERGGAQQQPLLTMPGTVPIEKFATLPATTCRGCWNPANFQETPILEPVTHAASRAGRTRPRRAASPVAPARVRPAAPSRRGVGCVSGTATRSRSVGDA